MAEPVENRPGPTINGGPRTALVVVPCRPLQPTLEFFTKRLGFGVDAIFPADSPATAELSGHGLVLRLEPGVGDAPGVHLTIRLRCDDPAAVAGGETVLVAPNGTRVELVDVDPALVLPPVQQSLVITRMRDDASWGVGRAGMEYRDVIPGRQGGRFIGSHIRITTDGPVPDYVHYHKVRFQMIYCHTGWVRLVYEDQGEPFVLEAGDCVLQPPEIRHRVLESGGGLEVIELGCPAEHETLADHSMPLPTGRHDPTKDFGGQRFVRHDASEATWRPWRFAGFEYRDIGIGAATDGLAGVRVARPAGADRTPPSAHDVEFVFGFVLRGSCTLACEGHDPAELLDGDTFVIPAGLVHALTGCSPDFELLDVTLPELVPTP
jgi:quercetin dioxygenase-like cupin family protein